MQLTVSTADEQIVMIDVDADELVENVKALLEAETQIPLAHQRLLFNGKVLANTARLNVSGVKEGDLLFLGTAAPAGISGGGDDPLARRADGSAVNPLALQNHLRNDQNLMRQLQYQDPAQYEAIAGGDVQKLQEFLRARRRQELEIAERNKRAQQEQLALMYADPFDIDAQRKIEEQIQQQAIQENLANAWEHNPESFGQVVMLYVDMHVNQHPIKAFVDTGAQMTIMSSRCAERIGIMRLVDKQFQGVARGVGTGKIIGRVHMVMIKVGTVFLPCSITVLEQPNLEFIFGLDMLRKHQCSVDLKDNCLRLGSTEESVPFLAEKDIPRHLREDEGPSEEHKASGSTPAAQSGLAAPGPSVQPGQAPASLSPQPLPAAAPPQATSELEAKIQRLVELGFDHAAASNALTLCNGNEELAASYLFGG